MTPAPVNKTKKVFGFLDCGVKNTGSTLAPRPAIPETNKHKQSHPNIGIFLSQPYILFFQLLFLGDDLFLDWFTIYKGTKEQVS